MAKTAEPFRSLGFAAVDWVEHYLVHGPGDVQGQSIELDDEFAAFIVKAYQVDGAGARKVRRAFLSRSKGRNKSGLAAMIACFEALGPCRFDHFAEGGEVSSWGYEYEVGEPVGRPLAYVEILNVATEEGQAGNTYDAIYFMLNPDTCSGELLRDFGKIDVGITRTNLPDRRGFIEPVSSADSSKDGGKSTFIVADETHLWILPRLKRLHGIMTRNLLKRKIASGWMLETSTMYGEGEESVAEGTHAYAQQNKRDRTLLFDHKQAAETWDLTKRPERMKALREAYGPAAAWMNLDAICDSWDDPQVSEAEFRRYWLNQPVPTVLPDPGAIDYGAWMALEDPFTEAESVDYLAVETDLDRKWSSISAVGPRVDGLTHVEVAVHDRGAAWLLGKLAEMIPELGYPPVIIDGNGPAATLIQELTDLGFEVITIGTKEVAQSFALLLDAIAEATLRHGPQPELNEAVKQAQARPCGDGGTAFKRRNAGVTISPLTTVGFAHWAHQVLEKAGPNLW